MFGKNLTFYRLKQNLDKKALANLVGLTTQAISNYELGKRMPDMDTIQKLAAALHVKTTDFLIVRNENLEFQHAEFRKQSKFSLKKQSLIKSIVEEYCSRFFDIVEFLGGDVLPNPPKIHTLQLAATEEESAIALRRHLNLATEGPVLNLVGLLENQGILVLLHEMADSTFSGMNGTVNGRPYIIINRTMNNARMRTTLLHELAHLMFVWPATMSDNEREKLATAIAGAFLLPAVDARRELGLKRKRISNDMSAICDEYGVSMYLLTKRARICNIISENAEKAFYIKANSMGWRAAEPERGARENSSLFEQLVCRAVSEDQISLQKGVELLQIPIADLIRRCNFSGGDVA